MVSRREAFFSPYFDSPFFTKETLWASALQFNLPESTFNSLIEKALRKGEIIHLKRGHYVTSAFFNHHRTDQSYLFFLANALLKPSYITLEAALQYYGFFAEAVNYTITSVTPKLPRQFRNRTGIYLYRSISETLFTDFKTIKGNFEFTIALPHKAVFDYLYYYTDRFSKNVYENILEDLRIDVTELGVEEKRSLRELIARFTDIKIYL